MKLKNSVNNTQVFNRPCVGTQNALTDGGAETSEFGGDEP